LAKKKTRSETENTETEALPSTTRRFGNVKTTDERVLDAFPPTTAEARLHAAYARREIRAYGGRCAKCDAGASHGAAECDALSEALKNTTFAAPGVPPPVVGFVDASRTRVSHAARLDVGPSPDVVTDPAVCARACVALLFQRRTRSETLAWFDRESPDSARRGVAELRLERRGLGPSLPSLSAFFALTLLDVSRNKLSSLPDDLGDISPLLETIDASANALETLPNGIGGLFFLRRLVARGNRLTDLPSLAGARALEHLDISVNTSLERVPDDLANVSPLRELIADGCVSLRSLPEALGENQPSLRTIRARRCALTRCPEGAALARALETLDLGSNRLVFVPEDLGGAQQPSLRVVRVDDNMLRRLPAGLRQADALEVLDCSSNALHDVAPLVGCGSLVDLNVADNAIAELPRNLAGGPARARAAHAAKRAGLERAGSSTRARARALDESASPSRAARGEPEGDPSDPREVKRTADTKHNLTRSCREREREKVKRKLEDAERAAAAAALANASRVVGLRRLRAANNRLKRLPPCLGATLAVGGAGGRVVDVRGNPLEPPVRSLLAEPGGVDAYIDRLASTHSETARVSPAPPRRALEDAEAVAETLEALTNDKRFTERRREGSIGTRVTTTCSRRAFVVSREAPGRMSRIAADFPKPETEASPATTEDATRGEAFRAGKKSRVSRVARRIARISWGGEAFTTVFASRVAADPSFAERHAALERARASAVAARAKAVSARARRRWRLAIFSALKRVTPSQALAIEAVEGMARRERFREAVADAARRERETDRARYAWILDAPSPLDALPHRLRCALARKCRAFVASERESVWNAGDDGDFAVVITEGTCALWDPEDGNAATDATTDGAFEEFEEFEESATRTSGPRHVVSAETVSARAAASGVSPPPRPGARACAGVASLLAGEPRRLTLSVTSRRARYFAIPRSALIEVLNEDDAARAREFRERRARVAGAARAAASDIFSKDLFQRLPKGSLRRASGDAGGDFATSDWDDSASDVSRVSRVSRWAAEEKAAETDARLADAESRALRAHATASRSRPPEPSPREALFSAEARRAARDAFPEFFDSLAEDDPEKVALLGSRARRARVTAHALGLGPPVGLYAARDRRAFPWTRGWRDGGWTRDSRDPLNGFVSGLETNTRVAPLRRVSDTDDTDDTNDTNDTDDTNAHDDDGFSLEYFQASRDHSEPAALRSARLESGGAVARDRLRGCRVLREALSGAETRHVAHFCGAETVTCANETGGTDTDDDDTDEKEARLKSASKKTRRAVPTAAEAAAAMGVADARAERVARVVTKRARFFAERDDDDSGAAFLVVDGFAELSRSDGANGGGVSARSVTTHGVGELLGATQLLTGSKPDATATVAKQILGGGAGGAVSVSATAIHPAALRAVIDRRPVILDAIATFVARQETFGSRSFFKRESSSNESPNDDSNVPRVALEAAAARRAARLVAAAEARFGNARRGWRRAAETVLAQLRKRKHADALARGGVDAFRAAALGVAGAAEADEADPCRVTVSSHSTKEERNAKKFARGVPDARLARELARAAPFGWLTPSEAVALVALGARRVRATREGEPLCVQGHAAATAFVVLKGKLEALEKKPSSSSSVGVDFDFDAETRGEASYGSRVKMLSRGDVIGAESLFTGAARRATVFALSEEAWVLEIQRKAVTVLARRRPTALDEIAAVVRRLDRDGEVCVAERRNDPVRNDATRKPSSRSQNTLETGGSLSVRSIDSAYYLHAIESVNAWVLRGERHETLRPEVLYGTGGATRARLAFGAPTRAALAAIKGAAVFDGVDRIRRLVMLHDAARLVTHPPGSAVVTQGDDGAAMFAVVRGTLDAVVERLRSDEPSASARRFQNPRNRIGVDLSDVVFETVRVLGPGDVFGELSLLTGAPRNATVRVRAAPDAAPDAARDFQNQNRPSALLSATSGAVLVEIGVSAIAPLLRNRDTDFARSASLATARRYAPAGGFAASAASDASVEAYARELERAARRFHVAAASRGAASLLSATTTRRAARAFLAGKKIEKRPAGGDAHHGGSAPSEAHGSVPHDAAETERRISFSASSPPPKPKRRTTNDEKKHWRVALAMTTETTARREGFEAFTETFAKRLARHPFFSLLTRAELRELKSASRLRRARAGESLKRTGDVADSLLVVVSGVVNARFETTAFRDDRVSNTAFEHATEALHPWCCVGARHAILHDLHELDRRSEENRRGEKTVAAEVSTVSFAATRERVPEHFETSSFVWPATLAAAPPSAEAVEIPSRAIAEIIRARPTLRVLVDSLDAEGRLR
jgi:Leucine-rich repeat (LRR) protein/CRP-like cAMP-binding protein